MSPPDLTRDLEPCPFCKKALTIRGGVNPYGRCDTPDCWMHRRAYAIPLDDPEQVRQWNECASGEPAAPAGAEVVKALVWNEYEREGQVGEWDASSGFDGFYNITLQATCYRVICPDVEHDCATIDAAKAAAQADYEARIRSALTHPAPADKGVEQ